MNTPLQNGDRVKGYGSRVPASTTAAYGTVESNLSGSGKDSDPIIVVWDNGTKSVHEAFELKRK